MSVAENIVQSTGVSFDSIPMALVERPRWVLWRGKKIPYCANAPSKTASSTDPATWSSFDSVRAGYSSARDGGIGFVLTGGDGLACIDIDHNAGPEAVGLLRNLNCQYIERSPSGNGLHGWGLFCGDLPRKKGRYRGLEVEIYRDQRYMTVTGDVVRAGPFSPLVGIPELSADLQKRTEEHGGAQRMTEVIFRPLLSSSVGSFLPAEIGQRNKRLFELARYLKGSMPNAQKEELRPIVEEWHRLALPVIGTKDFATTWTDFLRGLDRVRHPHGATMQSILEKIDHDIPVSDAIKRLGYGDSAHRLIRICAALQDHAGEEPFFLSARQAGDLIECHFTDASKILAAFVADDVLELVAKGSGKVASRYRWIGGRISKLNGRRKSA